MFFVYWRTPLTLYKIAFQYSKNNRNLNSKYKILNRKWILEKTNPAGVVKLKKNIKLFTHLLLSHFSNLWSCSTVIIVNRNQSPPQKISMQLSTLLQKPFPQFWQSLNTSMMNAKNQCDLSLLYCLHHISVFIQRWPSLETWCTKKLLILNVHSFPVLSSKKWWEN